MQADEDVGKIALAVPVLVCEYFWLFKPSDSVIEVASQVVSYWFLLLIQLFLNINAAKALELFLQDLCDRTYEITLQKGAKTMSSLHL